jgi:hypothetical protein
MKFQRSSRSEYLKLNWTIATDYLRAIEDQLQRMSDNEGLADEIPSREQIEMVLLAAEVVGERLVDTPDIEVVKSSIRTLMEEVSKLTGWLKHNKDAPDFVTAPLIIQKQAMLDAADAHSKTLRKLEGLQPIE